MDIKTLYYLANFEHNFDDFKQRLDELFKNDDENSEYKLNLIDEKEKKYEQEMKGFINFLKHFTKIMVVMTTKNSKMVYNYFKTRFFGG
jgi:hypothetical protein